MTTIAEEFEKRVRALDKRARDAGTNMTAICKITGLARVTYERWTSRAPQSLHKLDELEEAVARAERERPAA